MPFRSSYPAALRWLYGLLLLATGAFAFAQQDPPGIVARLDHHEGTVSFSPAGDDSFYDAVPNRPITSGDRLWTDRGARAELHVGSSALRVDGQTSLEFSDIGDQTVRLTVLQGSLQVRVRDDLAGQRLEINTGNLAFVIHAPGEYRFDADQQAGTTRVSVLSGSGTAYGENGESLPLGARQQLAVSGRNLQAGGLPPIQTADAFERWVAERNRLEDQSVSARYVSRGVVGYQQLDQHGDWQHDAEFGAVWYPRSVDADWAPYRDGQWVNVAPWGWTWVDAAPWGFAPSHYGRWGRFGTRWGWVPGRPQPRPVYSPALVGFVGGAGAGAGFTIGGGRNGVGWFPLAPNEEWRPGYRASRRYIDEANRTALHGRQIPWRGDFFAHQRVPDAVTVVPAEHFGRGPLGRRDHIRMPDDRFARVPAATAPPIPLPALGAGAFGGMGGRPALAQPPAALQARQQQAQMQQFQQVQQQRDAVQRIQQGQAVAQQQQQIQQQQNSLRQAQEAQQRAIQSQQQQQQAIQQQQASRQAQEAQQQDAVRQAQDAHLRTQQRALREQTTQQQQQLQQLQQQQVLRQVQEAQQRAAQQQAVQQQQQQQMQQQQQQMQQQNALRQAQEAQQRAAQQQAMQQQVLQQQAMQQQAMRQAQEAQQRAAQQMQMQQSQLRGQQMQPRHGGPPGVRGPNDQP